MDTADQRLARARVEGRRKLADAPRAAVYCRLSVAAVGDTTKVEDQERISRELAKRKGWRVAGVYADNNKSAWQPNRNRPGWDQMLKDVEAGLVDAIVVYLPAIGARNIEQLEDNIAAADLAGGGQHRDCPAADGKPEPRVDFARARGMQDHVVRAPVGSDGGPAAFGHHGEDGHLKAGPAQLSHQALGLHKITTCVNQHHVSGRAAGRRGSPGRRQPDRMRQQA